MLNRVYKTLLQVAKLTPMVHRKTEPTGPGTKTVIVSKIDAHDL